MKSHLRNSIAVALMGFVLAMTAFEAVCAPVCAQTSRHACCDDGTGCGVHQASANAACEHQVAAVAERVEWPELIGPVLVALVRVEYSPVAATVGVPVARMADLPPPRWFDPLVMALRV